MGRNIFISYRRADSEGLAGRIYDRLVEHFGADRVFLDVTNISVGEDFVDAIGQAIGSCQIVLVLIGPRWASIADEMGQKRLDDPHDFVRLEISSAIELGVRVIPVLVHGAEMPKAEELPSEFEPLTRRNAYEIRHRHFDNDVNFLVDELSGYMGDAGIGINSISRIWRSRQIPIWGWFLALATVVVIGFAIFWWRGQNEAARELEVAANQTKTAAAQIVEINPAKETPAPPIATSTLTPSATPAPPTITETPTITPTPTNTLPPTTTPYPTQLMDALGITMVYIPEGPFTMGTDGRDPWDIVANPAHELLLSAFYIDKYEVSNSQYARCVDAGICSPPKNLGSKQRRAYYESTEYADYPVIYVNWSAASIFCSWRGGRLPEEAEWEKAARSDDQRNYPWGDEEAPNCQLANYWPTGACEGDTVSVKDNARGASPYGALNLSGNVAEWVKDWFQAYPQGNPSASKDFGQSARVIRGGTYFDRTNYIRTTNRTGLNPDSAQSYVGFRCVVELANIP